MGVAICKVGSNGFSGIDKSSRDLIPLFVKCVSCILYPCILYFVCCITPLPLTSQQTVGLFLNSEEAYDGYTLFCPIASRTTYLIDNCGYKVHSWPSEFRPGLSVYLQEDGSLVRTGVIQSQFIGAGTGGRLERLSWEGEVLWSYNYSSETFHQHHDIEVLPNGNILLIAWELLTRDEAIALGRLPESISNNIWPDHIVELKPIGFDDAEIVWEWHVTDHLIQNVDSEKPGYGVISEHPELVDINYRGPGNFPSSTDWNHTNSVDYWPEEDLILLSSRSFSELWVIDHSTTTEESRGHTGGRFGKGGDLLYRWGNPEAYKRGTSQHRRLYGQHDADWITEGESAGDIVVFNNGANRPGGNRSSVDLIVPPFDSELGFSLSGSSAFGPDEANWSYEDSDGDGFYSSALSGVAHLPNGNILACVGGSGTFFEITPTKERAWQYINPIAGGSPVEQGQSAGSNNVFKIERYGPDYAAFENRILERDGRIELQPFPDECTLFPEDSTVSVSVPRLIEGDLFKLLGNPVRTQLMFEITGGTSPDISLTDIHGKSIYQWRRAQTGFYTMSHNLVPGIYVLSALDGKSGMFQTQLVVFQ